MIILLTALQHAYVLKYNINIVQLLKVVDTHTFYKKSW